MISRMKREGCWVDVWVYLISLISREVRPYGLTLSLELIKHINRFYLVTDLVCLCNFIGLLTVAFKRRTTDFEVLDSFARLMDGGAPEFNLVPKFSL